MKPKLNDEKILFLTDIPPCENYTGGIMLSWLIRFLLEEKRKVDCFCVINKELKPKLYESIINDISMVTYYKNGEDLESLTLSKKQYYLEIKELEKNLLKYIKNNKITKIICTIQGEIILSLINSIRKNTKIEYIVQIWDPIEWWIKEHHFDEYRKEKVLKMYEEVISNAKCCITTSDEMKKEYSLKYKVKCKKVMPPLEVFEKSDIKNNKNEKEFIISMAGQVYAKEETKQFLDALNEMKWQYNGKSIIFKHYGYWCDNYINLNVYNNEGKVRVLTTKFLPQEKLFEKLIYSDLLYCPYFFSEDEVYKKVSKLSFPSKLVTYMSLNIPILLHAPVYASPYKFLKTENAAYLLDTIDKKDIIREIKKIIDAKDDRKEIIIKNSKKLFLKNFDYNIVKKSFFDALEINYLDSKKLRILEVNNVDLPGRRFNGFDLQQMINTETKHSAKQIVTYKTSNDKNVLEFYKSKESLEKEWFLNNNEYEELSVHSQLSFTSNILKDNDYFVYADVVHYHLIHNTKLSLYKMIDLCKNKPSVITIHDPWFFTGRCVYPQECDKWVNGCKNCENLGNLFPFKEKNCESLWKLKKYVYQNLDIDFVVTTPFMMNMIKQSPLTKNLKNVHLIPFGIDLLKFSNNGISKMEAREQLGIDNEDMVLFFRAQMAMKGTEYIIDALKKLKSKKKITLLTCSGVGLLKELENDYNVIDLGHIEDDKMVVAYNACDIFLMPSRGESFGLMAIEAMACSRPVVVFNNSALPYVTFAPECGILVKNKDSKDLMNKIKWLIDNKDEREKRGQLGRKLAEEHYDVNVYNNRIVKLYEDVYNRQKSKNIVKYNEANIDYDVKDVQILIRKFKRIYTNVFCGEILNAEFLKYEKDMPIDESKIIDYSLISVQNLIQQFNQYMYNKLIDIEEAASISHEREPLKQKLVKRFSNTKEKVRNKIEKYPLIYYPMRFTYKVVRKIKRIIFNDYYRMLSEKVDFFIEQQNCKVQTLLDKLKLQEQYFIGLNNELLCKNEEFTQKMDDSIKKIEELENLSNILKNDIDEKNAELKLLKEDLYNDINSVFYYHGGSGNHGCEALIKTIFKLGNFKREESLLCSYVANEDKKFGVNKIIKYIRQSNQDAEEIMNFNFNPKSIAISIGGDNYCGYDYGTKKLEKYNRILNEKGVTTALIGCSIEPDVLNHQEVLDDLNRFALITARESITYDALIEKGINRNTHLIPDSAFILEPSYLPLPIGFEEGNTIGINVSNLVQSYDKKNNITYDNFKNLIEYIIKNTKYKIALIPHVVQAHNDDMGTLMKLYDEFKETNRVILINDCNCSEIKGYISKCKILVCSRTHASISGYSSRIPTLVLGYSVKSRGIAKDIFGTDKNYVISVHDLKTEYDLTNSFIWIEKEYKKIKNHLNEFMPNYIKKCYDLSSLIEDIRENGNPNMTLASKSLCSGCGACKSICPQNCITMDEDKDGFLYPKIDYTKCTNCDLCRINCPINKKFISYKSEKVYAGINKDLNVRMKSSSGGIFSLLAEKIIDENGLVFGAAYNENNEVEHILVDNKEDLYKLRGSKYVQSNLKDTFLLIKNNLKNNKKVLFSGTPCQIQGLKSYLGKDYSNLLCVDFICHGVPSPKVFKEYLEQLSIQNSSHIKNINFRDKAKGWKQYEINFEFDNGKELKKYHSDDIYMRAFLKDLILRESCYNCNANNFRSGSDITLGDFWGVEEIHPKLDDNKGVSIIILNSKKGEELLNSISKNVKLIESNIDFVIKKNHCLVESVSMNINRKNFFENIETNDIINTIEKNIE